MPNRDLFNIYQRRLHTLYGNATKPDPSSEALAPGWNLVSLPAGPINAVLGNHHPASSVSTYDPTQPGAWLSASRTEDGVFVGSLEKISAHLGYWVFSAARQV